MLKKRRQNLPLNNRAMADVTQNVIIEFISDTTQLQPGIDKLVESGKVEKQVGEEFKKTNAEILKQQQALANIGKVTSQIDATGKITKKNLGDLVSIIKGQSTQFQNEIKKGVIDALHKAGLSAKEFEKLLAESLGGAEPKLAPLKSQLRSLTEQLAQLKINGQENSQQFTDLAKQAGVLRDAIGDANLQVKNFASDTSTFDGLLSLTSGLAGGFAVVQGAEALFGDESKELQKTLLRVNAAMAILQGLQQVQLFLQKESAAATLANTIATKAQSIALGIYNFVVGTSTGLTKAFRIALASTGVGLLIIGLVELINVLNTTDSSLEDVNAELERQKNLTDALNQGIQDTVDIEVARAEAAGAAESRLTALRGKGLQQQLRNTLQLNEDLIAQRDALHENTDAWVSANKAIQANKEIIDTLNKSVLLENIKFQRQLVKESLENIVSIAQARADAAKKNSAEDFAAQKSLERVKANLAIESAGQNNDKIAEIRSTLNKKLRDIDRASREQGQKDVLADLETQLLEAQAKSKFINERTTQSEIDLQKKIILKKAQFESEQEGLSQKQILEIKTKGLEDANKLQRDFSKQTNKEILDDAISRNNAELQKIGLTEKDKLSFVIDNLILTAQKEIEDSGGLSEKIKEINAKRDRDIKEARLASIKSTLEAELAESDNAPILRHLEKSLSDQQVLRNASTRFEEERLKKELGIKKLSLAQEKGLIDSITAISLDANFKRIAALNEERRQGLISQADYNTEYKKLIEDQTKIVEEGEKKKTDTTKEESAKRLQQTKDDIGAAVKVAEVVSDILSGIADIQTQRENEKISAERQHVKELQDAGAITEKDAIIRMKKIDAEERRIKQQQAQRDKAIALFNAIISTARGIAEAIPNPFLIALAAAVGAAQIAIIAAKPIPKFAKGKKDRYEGVGMVGEAGSELIEKNGRMYVAEKPEVVWLAKTDKVYSHKETVAMISKPQMSTERNPAIINSNKGIIIDYDKIGEAVGKHTQTNVFVDGVQEQSIKKKEFINYLNNRRSF